MGKRGLVAYASAGRITPAHRRALIDWWEAGAAFADMPPHGHGNAEDVGNLLIVSVEPTETVAQVLSYVSPYPVRRGWPLAFGSGGDFAIGAMEAGLNAMEAVAIADRRDNGTGGAIEFIDTHDLAAGVQTVLGMVSNGRKAVAQSVDVKLPPAPARYLDDDGYIARDEHGNKFAVNSPIMPWAPGSGMDDIVGSYPNFFGFRGGAHYPSGNPATGPMHEYREFLTYGRLDRTEAWNDLRDEIRDYLATTPGNCIYWRTLPEVRPDPEHAKRWVGYARLVLVEREAHTPAPKLTHRVIRKPNKDPLGPGIATWATDCTGRLVLGTGCGRCLRCNREWHGLARRFGRGHDGNPDQIMISVQDAEKLAIEWADKQVRDLNEEAIGEAMADAAALGIGVTRIAYAAFMPTDAHAEFESWVVSYNAAQAAGDMKRVRELDDQLRGMQFPAGCELITDEPDTEFPYWRRRLVWVTCEHDQAHARASGAADGTAKA